jgi:hypothetical protein
LKIQLPYGHDHDDPFIKRREQFDNLRPG